MIHTFALSALHMDVNIWEAGIFLRSHKCYFLLLYVSIVSYLTLFISPPSLPPQWKPIHSGSNQRLYQSGGHDENPSEKLSHLMTLTKSERKRKSPEKAAKKKWEDNIPNKERKKCPKIYGVNPKECEPLVNKKGSSWGPVLRIRHWYTRGLRRGVRRYSLRKSQNWYSPSLSRWILLCPGSNRTITEQNASQWTVYNCCWGCVGVYWDLTLFDNPWSSYV